MKWTAFATPSGGVYRIRTENIRAMRLVPEDGGQKSHGLISMGRHIGGDHNAITVTYEAAVQAIQGMLKEESRERSLIEIGPRADKLIRDLYPDQAGMVKDVIEVLDDVDLSGEDDEE